MVFGRLCGSPRNCPSVCRFDSQTAAAAQCADESSKIFIIKTNLPITTRAATRCGCARHGATHTKQQQQVNDAAAAADDAPGGLAGRWRRSARFKFGLTARAADFLTLDACLPARSLARRACSAASACARRRFWLCKCLWMLFGLDKPRRAVAHSIHYLMRSFWPRRH